MHITNFISTIECPLTLGVRRDSRKTSLSPSSSKHSSLEVIRSLIGPIAIVDDDIPIILDLWQTSLFAIVWFLPGRYFY